MSEPVRPADDVRDESHIWPIVQCYKTEPHQAHRWVGRCGLPDWCPGLIDGADRG